MAKSRTWARLEKDVLKEVVDKVKIEEKDSKGKLRSRKVLRLRDNREELQEAATELVKAAFDFRTVSADVREKQGREKITDSEFKKALNAQSGKRLERAAERLYLAFSIVVPLVDEFDSKLASEIEEKLETLSARQRISPVSTEVKTPVYV